MSKAILELCQSCAAEVYGTKRPSPSYADAVARLLVGTAATESHFVYRRQRGFDLKRMDGAWGLWQTEGAPLIDNLRYLRNRTDVAKRARAWLFQGIGNTDVSATFESSGTHCVLMQIHDWDRLACLMARVHYLRFPKPVPRDLTRQAQYYKTYYNTVAGKGSVSKYLNDWHTLVAHMLPQLQE